MQKHIKDFNSFVNENLNGYYTKEQYIKEGFLGNILYKVKSFFKGKSPLGSEVKDMFDQYDIPNRWEDIFDSRSSVDEVRALYSKVASGGELTADEAVVISNPIDLLLLSGYRLNNGRFDLSVDTKGSQNILKLFGFNYKSNNREEILSKKMDFLKNIKVPNPFDTSVSYSYPATQFIVFDLEFDFSRDIPEYVQKDLKFYSILEQDFVKYASEDRQIMDLSSKIESGQSMSNLISDRMKREGANPEVPVFSTISLGEYVEKLQVSNSVINMYVRALDEMDPSKLAQH
jgi:hypothetical protein